MTSTIQAASVISSCQSQQQHEVQDTSSSSSPSSSSTCCSSCGTSEAKLLQCSRCKSVSYCSVEHQRQNWKIHKPDCKPPQAQPVSSSNAVAGVKKQKKRESKQRKSKDGKEEDIKSGDKEQRPSAPVVLPAGAEFRVKRVHKQDQKLIRLLEDVEETRVYGYWVNKPTYDPLISFRCRLII